MKNIVIDKSIKDIVDFKQTVGRGTRVNHSENPFAEKYWFTIIDHRDTAKNFSDPEFDGVPDVKTIETWAKGKVKKTTKKPKEILTAGTILTRPIPKTRPVATGFSVKTALKKHYILDSKGDKIYMDELEDHTKKIVRKLYPNKMQLWKLIREKPEKRVDFKKQLQKEGIDLKLLQKII